MLKSLKIFVILDFNSLNSNIKSETTLDKEYSFNSSKFVLDDLYSNNNTYIIILIMQL